MNAHPRDSPHFTLFASCIRMIPVLLAIVIAASPDSTPCCVRANTFATSASAGTGHRVGHVISPMILTASFFGTALYFGANRKQARWIAVGLSLGAVLAKEVYDYRSEARAFGAQDVAIGAAATAAGLWLGESIPWPESNAHRVQRPDEARQRVTAR